MIRVLVIDDQPHVRATIAFALPKSDYEVVAVENGNAGLRKFDESKFDVVVVDIFMPGMDGANVIKALRERNPALPVIAISGVSMKSSGRTALEVLQASPKLAKVVCLQKPFKPNELQQAIKNALLVMGYAADSAAE